MFTVLVLLFMKTMLRQNNGEWLHLIPCRGKRELQPRILMFKFVLGVGGGGVLTQWETNVVSEHNKQYFSKSAQAKVLNIPNLNLATMGRLMTKLHKNSHTEFNSWFKQLSDQDWGDVLIRMLKNDMFNVTKSGGNYPTS